MHDETLLTITDPKATRSYEDKRPGDADVKIIIRSGRTKDETGIDSWTMGLARESVFYAHASILRGASRAFERTLSKDRPRSGFDLLLIEDDPIAFEFMMKWMYGKPFDASPALVTAWAAKGACPVLAMAKRLECDGLERSVAVSTTMASLCLSRTTSIPRRSLGCESHGKGCKNTRRTLIFLTIRS